MKLNANVLSERRAEGPALLVERVNLPECCHTLTFRHFSFTTRWPVDGAYEYANERCAKRRSDHDEQFWMSIMKNVIFAIEIYSPFRWILSDSRHQAAVIKWRLPSCKMEEKRRKEKAFGNINKALIIIFISQQWCRWMESDANFPLITFARSFRKMTNMENLCIASRKCF